MSPASGPVLEPKMFPAATMEDQEAVMEGRTEATVLGPPPFSSPDPASEARRMLPVEDGTSAHQAALDAEAVRTEGDYSKLDPKALKALADERGLEVEGTGKSGNVTKADFIAALHEDDAKDMKASDWKAEIDAAQDQDALDAVAQRYYDAGATYKTVEDAIDRKQGEIDNADNGS